jgi:hypothetical protein
MFVNSDVVFGFEVVELCKVDGNRSGARMYALQNAVCAGTHGQQTVHKH